MKQNTRSLTKPLTLFLIGAACGSVFTFFLDPSSGRRRRALTYEKSVRLKNDSSKLFGKVERNVMNHLKGYIARAKKYIKGIGVIDDKTLSERVRAEFGHKVRHSAAIDVAVQDGNVVLSGPVLKQEVNGLLACVRRVHGIKKIINKLNVHESRENIPELQGEGKPYLQ